jgi:hypothetical protein
MRQPSEVAQREDSPRRRDRGRAEALGGITMSRPNDSSSVEDWSSPDGWSAMRELRPGVGPLATVLEERRRDDPALGNTSMQ